MLFHTKLFKLPWCVFKKSPPMQYIKTVTYGQWIEPSTEQEINFSSVTTSQNLWKVKRIALEGLFLWEWCELTSNQLDTMQRCNDGLRWAAISTLKGDSHSIMYLVGFLSYGNLRSASNSTFKTALIQFQTLAWIFHFKCFFFYILYEMVKLLNVCSETETFLSKWDRKK